MSFVELDDFREKDFNRILIPDGIEHANEMRQLIAQLVDVVLCGGRDDEQHRRMDKRTDAYGQLIERPSDIFIAGRSFDKLHVVPGSEMMAEQVYCALPMVRASDNHVQRCQFRRVQRQLRTRTGAYQDSVTEPCRVRQLQRLLRNEDHERWLLDVFPGFLQFIVGQLLAADDVEQLLHLVSIVRKPRWHERIETIEIVGVLKRADNLARGFSYAANAGDLRWSSSESSLERSYSGGVDTRGQRNLYT